MTIFEHVNNIINTKKPVELRPGDDFNGFMAQRFISMISPEICAYLNETMNSDISGLSSKQMQHDYMMATFPKIGYRKIKYLKKSKKEVSPDVKEFAHRHQMSCREALMLLEEDKDLNKKEKTVEIFKKSS